MLVTESRARDQIDSTLVVRESLEHLFRLIEPNGRFIYAHRADRIGDQLDGYNMLRHCGTVWFMCTALSSLDISLSSEQRMSLAKAVKYVLKKVQEPSWNEVGLPKDEGGLPRLCLVTKKTVKLGGTGLALLMLRSFRALEEKQESGIVNISHDPDITVARLENYILSQASSGDFIHKRNFADGKIMTFRSDYYTGEAIYGLFQGSRITPKVQTIVEGLLNARYGIDVQSHWMAYAACEALTKGLLNPQVVVPYLTALMEAIIGDPSYRDRKESTPIACRSEALTIFLRTIDHSPLFAMQFSPTLVRQAQEAAVENLSLQMKWYNKGQFRKGNGDDKVQIDYIQHNAASFLNFSLLQNGLVHKGLLFRDLVPRSAQTAKTTSQARKHEPVLPFKTRSDFLRLKENEFPETGALKNWRVAVDGFKRRGFAHTRLGDFNKLVKDGRSVFTISTETDFTSLAGFQIFKNKITGKQLMTLAGAKTPEGNEFRTTDFEKALAYAANISPCVVKPVDGNLSRGVTVNVGPSNFPDAWKYASENTNSRILIERFLQGPKARYLVVDSQCVAVLQETQPFVIGDGRNTISALVDEKNNIRKHNPYLRDYPILLGRAQTEFLHRSGLRANSIIGAGEFVVLQDNPDLVDGGDTIDITLQADPGLKRMAENITSYLPGLDIIGFDVVAIDHCAADAGGDYIFLEGNTRPDICEHHFPTFGQPIDVAALIADYCERRLTQANAPRKRPAGHVSSDCPKDLTDKLPEENIYFGERHFDPHVEISARFGAHGFNSTALGRFLFLEKQGKRMVFHNSYTSFTSRPGELLPREKHLVKQLMDEAGISVAEGSLLTVADREEAKDVVKRLGQAVIKPAVGHRGEWIALGVTDENFDSAWQEVQNLAKSEVIVERYFPNATEMRYLVVDGECIAVGQRLPPHVFGDGVSSLERLVEVRNMRREFNPALRGSPIELTSLRRGLLIHRGLGLNSVPAKGENVAFDIRAGLATGGDLWNVTKTIHPGYRQIAEQVCNLLPDLHIAEIDVLARNHMVEPRAEDYIVVDANTCSDLGGYFFPTYGERVDVFDPIVQSCLRRLALEDQKTSSRLPLRNVSH
jgi:D-alanine-D-alanine ligase-like ATP-grasp enzyme